MHQGHVHHAHLVHDDQIIHEGIVLVPDESLLGVVFKEPVDGLGVGTGGLRHALRRPARGGCQGEGHAHSCKGVSDAADDGGLAGARSAGDDHDPGVQGAAHRRPLAFGEREAQLLLILGHVPEGIGCRWLGELDELVGDGGLHAGHEGLEDAPLLAHELLDEGPLGEHGVHGVGEELLVRTQEAAGFYDELIVRKIGVSVLRARVLQGELDAGEQPGGGVGLKAGHPLGDGVCGHETDAVDVVDELVGVLLDLGEGQISVGLVHAVGLVHRDAVGGEGHEDVPHGPVLVEGFYDHGQLLSADAGYLQKALRLVLHDLQRVHAESVHDEAGHGGTDALDGAAGKIVFNSKLCGRSQGLGEGDGELLTVLRVIRKGAFRPELFPGGGEGQRAAQGHEPIRRFRAQGKNGVPVVGVPVYDPVYDA